MRGWLKALLVIFVAPTLVGLAVLLVAGRPIAFEALKRRTAARFPEVKWISTYDLDRWTSDTGQPQPLILDARTPAEFSVSHLERAVQIDPYRPNLRSLGKTTKSDAIVVYSSAGYRGARVAEWLRRLGYTSVVNVVGGVFKWANEGRPLFRGNGRASLLVHPYDHRWGLLLKQSYRVEAPEVPKQSAAP